MGTVELRVMTKRTGSGPWAKGSTRAWRALRAAWLRREPYCQAPGCDRTATEVDHIKPVSQGGTMLDENNLRSLCDEHHIKRHGKRPRPEIDPSTGLPLSNHWWSET